MRADDVSPYHGGPSCARRVTIAGADDVRARHIIPFRHLPTELRLLSWNTLNGISTDAHSFQSLCNVRKPGILLLQELRGTHVGPDDILLAGGDLNFSPVGAAGYSTQKEDNRLEEDARRLAALAVLGLTGPDSEPEGLFTRTDPNPKHLPAHRRPRTCREGQKAGGEATVWRLTHPKGPMAPLFGWMPFLRYEKPPWHKVTTLLNSWASAMEKAIKEHDRRLTRTGELVGVKVGDDEWQAEEIRATPVGKITIASTEQHDMDQFVIPLAHRGRTLGALATLTQGLRVRVDLPTCLEHRRTTTDAAEIKKHFVDWAAKTTVPAFTKEGEGEGSLSRAKAEYQDVDIRRAFDLAEPRLAALYLERIGVPDSLCQFFRRATFQDVKVPLRNGPTRWMAGSESVELDPRADEMFLRGAGALLINDGAQQLQVPLEGAITLLGNIRGMAEQYDVPFLPDDNVTFRGAQAERDAPGFLGGYADDLMIGHERVPFLKELFRLLERFYRVIGCTISKAKSWWMAVNCDSPVEVAGLRRVEKGGELDGIYPAAVLHAAAIVHQNTKRIIMDHFEGHADRLDAHRTLLRALRSEHQDPIPRGLRQGVAAAGGVPFYMSDLEPRATMKYEGRIPADPWQLPPEEPGAEGYVVFRGGKRGPQALVRPQAWMDGRRDAEPAGAAAAAAGPPPSGEQTRGEEAGTPAAEGGLAQNEFPVEPDDDFIFDPDDVVPAQEGAEEEWDPEDDGEMDQRWADACCESCKQIICECQPGKRRRLAKVAQRRAAKTGGAKDGNKLATQLLRMKFETALQRSEALKRRVQADPSARELWSNRWGRGMPPAQRNELAALLKAAGAEGAPSCSRGHTCAEGAGDDEGEHWFCDACKRCRPEECEGCPKCEHSVERWMCATCKEDYCFDCYPRPGSGGSGAAGAAGAAGEAPPGGADQPASQEAHRSRRPLYAHLPRAKEWWPGLKEKEQQCPQRSVWFVCTGRPGNIPRIHRIAAVLQSLQNVHQAEVAVEELGEGDERQPSGYCMRRDDWQGDPALQYGPRLALIFAALRETQRVVGLKAASHTMADVNGG
eukprot:gene2389-27425_t